MAVPEWVDIVKTGIAKELAPYDEDWFYTRTASVARHIYIRSPGGVATVQKIYGISKNNGSSPCHWSRPSGSVARKALQALEKLNLVEKDPNGGRRMTGQGRRDLDRIAAQLKNDWPRKRGRRHGACVRRRRRRGRCRASQTGGGSGRRDSIKNVKARLFCGFSSDSPLHTVKLDTVKFVIFPSIPSDGKQCWITVEGNSIHLNQRVKPERVEFVADKPFDHFTLELDVESSLARGEFGQASWMTLPLLIILVTAVLHWQKVSPYLAGLADQIERAIMKGRGNGRRARSPGPDTDNMSAEDIDKAVKFVEASTRKRIKPKKI